MRAIQEALGQVPIEQWMTLFWGSLMVYFAVRFFSDDLFG